MKDKKNGFTLIELILVIAIIGIMSVATIVSLQGGKVKKDLESSAREVSAAIRESQNSALTGKIASESCKRYYFSYTSSSVNYTVGGSGCPEIQYKLKNGVTFASGGSFSFEVPFGTLSTSGNVSIQLRKNGESYYICVGPSGSILEQKDACP